MLLPAKEDMVYIRYLDWTHRFRRIPFMVFCKGKGDCEQVGYVSNLLLVLQSINSKLVQKDQD